MFNGIVEEIGRVETLILRRDLGSLKVQAKKIVKGTKKGDSIAVNGVCLTVTKVDGLYLTFDMMKETLLKTTLGNLKANQEINLERALKVTDRIHGHFVTGHVDDITMIQEKILSANYVELRLGLKKSFSPSIVPKGSVCLDGVSLSIGEVKKRYFSVYLIPFTKQITTLGEKKKGDLINIETDILAKYVTTTITSTL